MIHRITLPTPFTVGPVHTYLVEGEPLTLVDTGPDTPEALAALEEGLAALGHCVEDIQQILITHDHIDHFGLAQRLVERAGALVMAHPLAAPEVMGCPEFQAEAERFWQRLLLESGLPDEDILRSAAQMRSYQRYRGNVAVDSLMNDGDDLMLAGARWQVLHCPGHADSLVCFFEPTDRILIGNDHLLANISSNAIVSPPRPGETERRQPLVDYGVSLQRVAELDVAVTLTGHGPEVHNTNELIAQRFRFRQRRLDRLLALLNGTNYTVWGLVQALFPGLPPAQSFLAVSEVVGHLDILLNEGKVLADRDNAGVLHWFGRV